MRIYLPNMGYPSMEVTEEQREEVRKTRMFTGTGGPIIPMPGLISISRVAMPGLVMEEYLTREVGIAPQMAQHIPLTVDCYSKIDGADGLPLLARHRWSNDGIWQKGEPIYVTGEWDESVSPATAEPLPPLEPVKHSILTTGDISEGGEVRVGKAKAA
jgi:hypothetical protein